MPLLNRCCCCLNLRTGVITLGTISLITSVILLIPLSLSLVFVETVADIFLKLVRSHLGSNNTSSVISDDNADATEYIVNVFYVVLLCLVVLVAIFLINSALLIWGSSASKRFLLLPWIVIEVILILINIAFWILIMVMIGKGYIIAALFGGMVLDVGINIYLWLCVVSLFQWFGEQEGGENRAWEMKGRFTSTPPAYNQVPQEPENA